MRNAGACGCYSPRVRIVPLLTSLCLLVVSACPAPEPVAATAPAAESPQKIERRAKKALEKATEEKSADALLEVYNEYPKQSSGKEALRRAARMLLADVKERADACDEAAAKGKLARIAPFTLADAEINESYDSMQKEISEGHSRCQLTELDATIKKAETAWDWPGVFGAIQRAKDIDGATLKQRRLGAVTRWQAFLDATVRSLASGKSTLDDEHAQKLLTAVDTSQMPGELETELAKWSPAVATTVLVFKTFEAGRLLTPPKRVSTFGPARARKVATPKTIDGPVLGKSIPFTAIAVGKLDGVQVLVAGDDVADVVLRLASAKLLFAVSETKGFETKK